MRRRVLILAGFALLFASCGGGEETTATPVTAEGTQAEAGGTTTGEPAAKGDATAGKKIFAEQGCGGCHVLEDAGTSGSVGPNLDEAKPSLELAIDRVTNGKPPMPAFKDKLSEQEILDVATYVVQATSS